MHEAWGFLAWFGFTFLRGMIADGAVNPLAVVKHFDPFKDDRFGSGPGGRALRGLPQSLDDGEFPVTGAL